MSNSKHKPNPKLNILNPKVTKRAKSRLDWIPYSGKETGYLDNYFCDPRSEEFPIRDLRDIKGRNKKEPQYEDLTFNQYARCNQNFLNAALKREDSYIFFYTKYEGLIKEWKGKYLITGYYKLARKAWIEDKSRWAVKATEGKFVHILDAYPLEKIIMKKITNPRYGRGPIDAKKVKLLLKYFSNKVNQTKNYISETEKLY